MAVLSNTYSSSVQYLCNNLLKNKISYRPCLVFSYHYELSFPGDGILQAVFINFEIAIKEELGFWNKYYFGLSNINLESELTYIVWIPATYFMFNHLLLTVLIVKFGSDYTSLLASYFAWKLQIDSLFAQECSLTVAVQGRVLRVLGDHRRKIHCNGMVYFLALPFSLFFLQCTTAYTNLQFTDSLRTERKR